MSNAYAKCMVCDWACENNTYRHQTTCHQTKGDISTLGRGRTHGWGRGGQRAQLLPPPFPL